MRTDRFFRVRNRHTIWCEQGLKGLAAMAAASFFCMASLLFLGLPLAWAGENSVSGDIHLALVNTHIIRVSRKSADALTVVETTTGRYFVPSADTVPTKDPAVSLRLVDPGKIETLMVTLAGQDAVLLLSEDASGLVVGCIRAAGPAYVAPLSLVRCR